MGESPAVRVRKKNERKNKNEGASLLLQIRRFRGRKDPNRTHLKIYRIMKEGKINRRGGRYEHSVLRSGQWSARGGGVFPWTSACMDLAYPQHISLSASSWSRKVLAYNAESYANPPNLEGASFKFAQTALVRCMSFRVFISPEIWVCTAKWTHA